MTKNFSILFVILAAVVVGFFTFNYQTKVSIVSNKTEEIKQPDQITFLVLGQMGKVEGWNMAPDLTDAIVLVDYRTKIGVVNLISLPRDLYVDLGGEKFKINEVARRGKIKELLDKLPEITGLYADKYVVVNIDLLKSAVDNLGGIDLVLNSDVVDRVSGFTMKAGNNHLNGDDAVWLARNRFSPEGDFFREKNQHREIQAIVSKYKSLSQLEKITFLMKMTPEIGRLETNMDFKQLIPIIEKFNDARFNDVVMDFGVDLLKSSSTLVGTSTMYILVPKIGENDYTDIKGYINGKLEQ